MAQMPSAEPHPAPFPKRRNTLSPLHWGLWMAVSMGWLWGWAVVAPAGAVESVWEVLPYRVHLVVAVGAGPSWPPDLDRLLAEYLKVRCESWMGALWQVHAEPAPWALARRMLAGLEALHEAELLSEGPEADKVLLVAVGGQGPPYQVQVREWDVRTRWWGSTVSKEVLQPAKLAQTVLRAVVEAFCPLARIDRPKEGRAVLRPRGMALPGAEGVPAWIQPGRVFRPVVRKTDRQGQPLAIKPIPWTYLVVDRVGPQGLDCRIYSARPGALSERRRGRIEMLALAVIPPEKSTRLRLADQNAPEQPLVGYQVWTHAPGRRELIPLGRSDLRGEILIPPAEYGLQVLIVASGRTPVARLPVVPGLESRLEVLLPQDRPRLAAEGFVQAFEEALVDLVGQREILITQFQRRLQQGRTQEAAELLEELEALRRQREALAQQILEQEKTLTTPSAELRSKIQALWSRARQLLAQHADDQLLREMASQVLQAKQSAANPSPPATAPP